MKIALLDDYQDTIRTLGCFARIAGHEFTAWTDHTDDVDLLAERLRDTEVLLLLRERTAITAALLERLPKLRLISQFGGVPHIDLAACTRHGVLVCSRTVPGQPSYATAELTWGLMIAALRRIPQEWASLRAGHWQSPAGPGLTLRGRTLGIYGYGRIGGVVAGYGRAFGMDVQVFGRENSRSKARADGHAVAASAEALFETSDVITVHLPLNPQTRGIVTADLLGRMKKTALFVNTSRAPLVQPGALEAALAAGRPGLAAVDVYEHEPLTDTTHPLLTMPNVVATPHIGYVDRDGLERMFETIFDQVLDWQRGAPANMLNPEVRAKP